MRSPPGPTAPCGTRVTAASGGSTPSGNVTEFPVPALQATGIAAGPGRDAVGRGRHRRRAGQSAGRGVRDPAVRLLARATWCRSRASPTSQRHRQPRHRRARQRRPEPTASPPAATARCGSPPARTSSRVTPSGDVTRVSLPGEPARRRRHHHGRRRDDLVLGRGRSLRRRRAPRSGRYDPAGGGDAGLRRSAGARSTSCAARAARTCGCRPRRDSGRLNWITRLSTRSFGPAKPRQWSCAGQTAAACWFRIPAVPLGDQRLFNTHARPGGVTIGPDGNVWYTEGGKIGRILTFRGAMPCYERVTRNHNFGCGRQQQPRGEGDALRLRLPAHDLPLPDLPRLPGRRRAADHRRAPDRAGRLHHRPLRQPARAHPDPALDARTRSSTTAASWSTRPTRARTWAA